jgi:putative transposase
MRLIRTLRVLRIAMPSRVAIDGETKFLFDVLISPRRVTGPAAAFLGRLVKEHDLSEATFLVDGMSYLTLLARYNLFN